MPTPAPQSGSSKSNGGIKTLVKAEQLMQIALVLPVAVVIGWLIGVALDKWLHQHWIYIAGLIFGSIAGLMEAVRQALRASD